MLNLFKRSKPKTQIPTLTNEDYSEMLRLTNQNIRFLNATINTQQATVNTINPRRNKKKYAAITEAIEKTKARVIEETGWQKRFEAILNPSNN